jgi:hypothetical protein
MFIKYLIEKEKKCVSVNRTLTSSGSIHRNTFSYPFLSNLMNILHFSTSQCFCFDFFHVVFLLLLAKQQQQKIVNLYTVSVCYAWALIILLSQLENKNRVVSIGIFEKKIRKLEKNR